MKQALGFSVVLLALVLAPAHASAASQSVVSGASTYQATSPLAPEVRDLVPAPGTTIRAFFPRLSATIQTRGETLRVNSLRLYVDGKDVTAGMSRAGNTIAFVPHEHLQAGWHDVFVEGSDLADHSFSEAWVFRSTNLDVDLPLAGDDGFAFLPVGLQGPFTHFLLVSPFDGFGFVQFCNFEFPLARANGTPVFFVTVPVTLGTALLGCNPGLVFTPFQAGIGQLNPVFFPIEIAGPGFFDHPARRHPLAPTTAMPVYRSAMPVYRSAMPVYRTNIMPVYRSTSTMPAYRTQTMPIYRAPVSAPAPARAAAPHAASPTHPAVSVPHPYIPH